MITEQCSHLFWIVNVRGALEIKGLSSAIGHQCNSKQKKTGQKLLCGKEDETLNYRNVGTCGLAHECYQIY